MSSDSAMNRYARYGPSDRYPSPPPAGMCISVFAVIRKDHKVLVGIPRPHKFWTSRWIPQWLIYPKEELNKVYDKQSRLPSCYLLEGEHPDHALDRVMREQLGINQFSHSGPQVMSYNSISDWYPGESHWDLVFVYAVEKARPRKMKLPWWKELVFLDRRDLRERDFGWNEDLMKDLDLK